MMLRRLARCLVALPMISLGADAVLHPGDHVAAARDVADQAADLVGIKALSDTQLTLAVRAHGGVVALNGIGLALGIFPRLAAAKLAILTAPLLVVHCPVKPLPDSDADSSPQTGRADGLDHTGTLGDASAKPAWKHVFDRSRLVDFSRAAGMTGSALLVALDKPSKRSLAKKAARQSAHHDRKSSMQH